MKALAEIFEIIGDRLVSCSLREEVIYVPDGVRIIGARALKGCTSIKEIVFPESLERIEEHALKGCRQLEWVSFPNHLRFIGAYAFHRCHHLKEIQLPESVVELSDCAFLYCDSLEKASLPGVRKMGKQVFVNATSLKKLTISPDLLPECISDSFTGCTRISEIMIANMGSYPIDNLITIMEKKEEIPEIIRAIAADISHMMDVEDRVLVEFHVEPKEVVVPEGICEIGKSCFFDKRGIQKLHLPASLEKIGERAFRNCMNLEHLFLQNEKITIQKDAFKNCTNLKQITLNGNTYFLTGLPNQIKNRQMPELVHTIHTQLLENFCISGTVLLRYWGNEARVTVPDGITVIGERAFAGNKAIGKLILPESVIEIQQEAFADCVVLQTLNFPKGLRKIGISAFEGCVKLLRAEIPAGVITLSDSVFSRCRKLGQVVWEEKSKLKEIGQQVFYGCSKLKDLIFPETLERIGALAFYQCDTLRCIILPKAVKQMDAEAFACCKGLQEVIIEGKLSKWGRNLFAYAEKLKKVTFSEEQQILPEYFAWKCTELQQVIVSDALKMVGLAALEGTAFLKKFAEPKIWGTNFLDGKEQKNKVVIPDGVTAIAGGAFYGNSQITSLVLPETIEWIGERAFCSCTELKEVRLPKKVSVISSGAFAYCTKLKQVFADGTIKEVGEKAFYQCFSLESVPDFSQTKIGDYAFSGCREWKNGTIKKAQIGAYALEETGLLRAQFEKKWQTEKERVIYTTSVIIGDTIVDGSRAKGDVIFSTISSEICAIAPYAYYGNCQITRIVLPEGLKEIGDFAFCGCTRLCEVVIPDSVERIGNSAFEKCCQLLTFSSAATEVGKRAFSCNESLRFVSLPHIKVGKKETFFHCSRLETLEIEEVVKIEENCLKGCAALKQISFSQVKEIGIEAFAGCENLFSLCFSFGIQIAAKAFLDCCKLRTVKFSDCLAEFDHSAFWGSTFLEEIWIAEKKYTILGYEDLFSEELPELVRRIYASAIGCFSFQDTKAIVEYRTDACAVRIPNGVTAILEEVFKDCIRLEQVELPESVTYIGERAFWGTKWLQQKKKENPLVICNQILLDGTLANGCVVIPKEVNLISGWAFANCYGLLELIFCNRKLKIEPHAFRNCIYLKRVTTADETVYQLEGISAREDHTLPNEVKQIFEDALNCYKVDRHGILIECTGNITNFALVKGIAAIGNGVFQESNLLTYAALTEEVEWIGESAFARCKWLTSIRDADGVKEIGAMAFSGCIRLEQVSFSNLVRMGKQAFENCVLLKEIVLAEGLQEIPKRAFFRCRSLKKLVLPQSLERIEEEAFAFCDALEEIVLPKGLQKIGKRAFAWCKKLKKISIPEKVNAEEHAFEFSGFLQEKGD